MLQEALHERWRSHAETCVWRFTAAGVSVSAGGVTEFGAWDGTWDGTWDDDDWGGVDDGTWDAEDYIDPDACQ